MEYIPFEKPLAELEIKIAELNRVAITQAINLDKEMKVLEEKSLSLRNKMFANLSAYEVTQLSRHPKRPNSLEYIDLICSEFVELHGDRSFYDDPSIVGGLAKIEGHSVVIIGHQKGRGTKENIYRNFGMPKPEGYRKALRLMQMAERFNLAIITLIDTPGAYPGVGAEERGQSEAIGRNILEMSQLKVPIISTVIGEGGSGGALALAMGNKVNMMKYSIYSVISPEGCASILFKDSTKASKMADSLKLTAQDAKNFELIDSIVSEPLGGAHCKPKEAAQNLKNQILRDLIDLKKLRPSELQKQRIEKFTHIGQSAFAEEKGDISCDK